MFLVISRTRRVAKLVIGVGQILCISLKKCERSSECTVLIFSRHQQRNLKRYTRYYASSAGKLLTFTRQSWVRRVTETLSPDL